MLTKLHYRWPGAVAAPLLLLALGCSGNPSGSTKGTPATANEETTGAVAVEPLHLKQFEDTLSQYKGKVVLLDVWSIT